jgi:hypothetical protein
MKCEKCGQSIEDGQCFECAIAAAKSPPGDMKVEITESCAKELKRLIETAPEQDDDSAERIRAWFTKDELSLRWGDDSRRTCDLLCGWIDVHVDEIERDLNLNWVWTVISDEDPDSGSEEVGENQCVLVLPYTHRYVEIYPVGDWSKPEFEAAWEDGLPMSVDIESRISQAQEFGKGVKQGGGWLPETVSKALGDWVWNRVGRTADFVFDPDFTSELFKQIMASLPDALKEPTKPMGDFLDDIEDNALQDDDPE